MDIVQLTNQYKTIEELQIFCMSQFRQILQLSKKIKDLEEKNVQLDKKSKTSNNLDVSEPSLTSLNLVDPVTLKVLNDAKTIAQVQIKKLKDEAFTRELTLEEVKKLDIFNKILIDKEEKPKEKPLTAKTLKEDELLNLIGDASVSAK